MTPGLHTTIVRPEWVGARGRRHIVSDSQVEEQIRNEIALAVGQDASKINIHGVRRAGITRGAVYHPIQNCRLYRKMNVYRLVVSYNIIKGD